MKEVTLTLYKEDCKYITQVLQKTLNQMARETETDEKLKEEYFRLSKLIEEFQHASNNR